MLILALQAREQHKQREQDLIAAKLTAAQRSKMIKQQRLDQEAAREAEQRRLWQVSNG